VALPRAKDKPATPATLGIAEAPERRATRAELESRAAIVNDPRQVSEERVKPEGKDEGFRTTRARE